MRNVTITLTLGEVTARWVRLEAARQDTSVSRLIRNLLEEHVCQHRAYERAMERFLSRPATGLRDGGGYPAREEVHDLPTEGPQDGRDQDGLVVLNPFRAEPPAAG